jgi:hypothetical protein
MLSQPRELTVDEVREMFTQHVNTLIHYWSWLPSEPGNSDEQDRAWRLQGLAHSIFATLDGCSASLPGFIVAPMPHESDQSYHEENGENWFPHNDAEQIRCDIAGELRYWIKGG